LREREEREEREERRRAAEEKRHRQIGPYLAQAKEHMGEDASKEKIEHYALRLYAEPYLYDAALRIDYSTHYDDPFEEDPDVLELAIELRELDEQGRYKPVDKMSFEEMVDEGIGGICVIITWIGELLQEAGISLDGVSSKSEACYYGVAPFQIRVASHNIVYAESDTFIFIGVGGSSVYEATHYIEEGATTEEIKELVQNAVVLYETALRIYELAEDICWENDSDVTDCVEGMPQVPEDHIQQIVKLLKGCPHWAVKRLLRRSDSLIKVADSYPIVREAIDLGASTVKHE
jgi:hypothetical protein